MMRDLGMVLFLGLVTLAWGIGLTAVFFGPFYLLLWYLGMPLW